MSQSRRKYLGYPNAKNEPETRFLYPFGRGGGSSNCFPTMGKTSHAEKIEVSKFLVFNRYLVLLNSFSPTTGIAFYTNAGESCDVFGNCCDNSRGDPIDWWIALSHQGELTDEQIVSRGIKVESPPYDGSTPADQLFEFPVDKIPQPVLKDGGLDTRWQGEIWYQIYWGNVDAMAYAYTTNSTASSPPPEDFDPVLQINKVEKHDYDVEV